jgi:hypothetical protein
LSEWCLRSCIVGWLWAWLWWCLSSFDNNCLANFIWWFGYRYFLSTTIYLITWEAHCADCISSVLRIITTNDCNVVYMLNCKRLDSIGNLEEATKKTSSSICELLTFSVLSILFHPSWELTVCKRTSCRYYRWILTRTGEKIWNLKRL